MILMSQTGFSGLIQMGRFCTVKGLYNKIVNRDLNGQPSLYHL